MGRVTTMGEMASGIAHQLNQPLATILLDAEIAARKLQRGQEIRKEDLLEVFRRVADESHRAGQIIRRMRDYVKKATPNRSTLDVSELVDEVFELLRSDLWHADISFNSHVEPGLPNVLADRVQVQQLLLNLMRNAIEAMEHCPSGPRELTVRVRTKNHAVETTVTDSGPGLPEGRADHLFETFYSTKLGGMGMGLSISRSIVEIHGGRIWARQNPHQGATFAFTLPIPEEDQENGI